MPNSNEPGVLKNCFDFAMNLPRATVIGAMHFCNRPTDKKRLALAGVTLGTAAVFGLVPAFAVAAGGLAVGGVVVQTFAQPLFGVPRTTRDDFMGTTEALQIINKYRNHDGKAPLRFPKINL